MERPGEEKSKRAEKRDRAWRRKHAAEIIRANVTADRQARKEAEAVAGDVGKLSASVPEDSATRAVRRAYMRKLGKLEKRRLRLLERDDDYIRMLLSEKRGIEGMANLAGTADADEFLHVLVDQLELLPQLGALKPEGEHTDVRCGKTVKRRFMYPPELLNLLSILMRFLGLSSGPEVQSLVLTDPRWMLRLGFTLQEVEEGSTQRSVGLSGKTRAGEGGRFEEAGEGGPVRNRDDLKVKRGALSSQTLAGHEALLSLERLSALFNEAVRKVAEMGLLPKVIDGSLDSTCLEVSPQFEGAGVTRRKVKVHSKNRQPRQVETSIRGFKAWILMDTTTGIPLSVAIASIEVGDIVLARQVVEQAVANIAGHAELVGLAVDRGFLDGDFLHWLKSEKDINWVCPSKEKMTVTGEARTRVEEALTTARQKSPGSIDEDRLDTARRLARRCEVVDGVAFHEHDVGRDRANRTRKSLVTATVADLYETDFYGPGGSRSSRANSRKFRPIPLHATVVLNWPDRPQQDAADEREHDEENHRGPVVILSPVPEAGRLRYDRYDRRSLIENEVNREGKQHFSLGTSLVRNEGAMRSGVYFSALALLVWRILLWEQQALEEGDPNAEQLGIARYRRMLMQENADKLMLWADGRFGIFDHRSFLQMAGLGRT
jgi:hypothetical protein